MVADALTKSQASGAQLGILKALLSRSEARITFCDRSQRREQQSIRTTNAAKLNDELQVFGLYGVPGTPALTTGLAGECRIILETATRHAYWQHCGF